MVTGGLRNAARNRFFGGKQRFFAKAKAFKEPFPRTGRKASPSAHCPSLTFRKVPLALIQVMEVLLCGTDGDFLSWRHCRSSALMLRLSPSKARPFGSGIFPTSRMCRRWSRAASSGRGASWFEERLGPGVKIEWYVYNAGPSAMEAIFAKSLDLTYVGPNPGDQRLCALARRRDAHRRRRGERRLGAGGAGRPRLAKPADFRGKRIATPQFGNTQDVAARAWLVGRRPAHHADRRRRAGGADQQSRPALPVPAASSSTRSGPWSRGSRGSRSEAGGKVLVEEKDAITTVLVVERRASWPSNRDLAQAIRRGPSRADRVDPEEPGRGAAACRATSCRPRSALDMSPELVARAWSRMVDHADTSREAFQSFVTSAQQVGFLRDTPGSVAPDRGALMEAARPISSPMLRQARRRRRVEVVHPVARRTCTRSTTSRLHVGEGEFVCLRRPERLRQVDAARHHRRADQAGRRARARRRQAVEGPGRRAAGDVPGVGAVSRGSTSSAT